MPVLHATDRALLRVSGEESRDFLQGLVTNDVTRIDDGPVYAAMLTPQGKYLADFIMSADGDGIVLDCAAAQTSGLSLRLGMYKLRAKVEIAPDPRQVVLRWGDEAGAGIADPRHADLGTREYVNDLPEVTGTLEDYTGHRIALGVPSSGVDLISNDSYILEMGFERLNGVDFRKGCYVGQEVTARMKHKAELKKGLARVTLDGPAEPGTEILAGEKVAGDLRSVAGSEGLAYLRFDRTGGEMRAGDSKVTLV
ncbi:MAG: folate-binding protein [Pseudomonadota bacterium]